MRSLSDDELLDLEDQILDRIGSVLALKNQEGTLRKLLVDLGMGDLAPSESSVLPANPRGRILIAGVPDKMRNDIVGIVKSIGISSRRLVMLSYDEVTNYDFDNLRYNTTYCTVLIAAIPHSARGKGDAGSIAAQLEASPATYPPTRRLLARNSSNEMKATKTNVREALEALIAEGLVDRV